MKTRILEFTAILTLIFSASQAYAFRADEPLGQKQTAQALKVVPEKMPTAEQQASVNSLAGATVEWDKKTGAPASIRGADLAARNLGGKNLSLSAKNDFAADAVAVMDRLSSAYRLTDAAGEFAASKTEADQLGFHHVRLGQFYKGLKVVGGNLIVHFNKSGKAYQVNGRYIPDISINTSPAIDAKAAVAAAQADLAKMGKPTGALEGNANLVVYARDTDPTLAYELQLVYQDEKTGAGRWRYWVNANDGAIINRFNDVPKSSAAISGTLNSGEGGSSVSVTGEYNGGYYQLYYSSGHWKIWDYPYSRICRSSGATWGTTARLCSEMSAAYNFNKIQAYYLNVHSRNSYDDSGTLAVANVHVSGDTDNAFWYPSTQQFYFYPGSEYGELTVLDVCAHEFTHAVTEHSANLTYQYESGALNESFSDIFGTIVEFANQPSGTNAYPSRIAGYSDWLIGEDCTYTTSDTALRDMRNPQRYSNPSKYHGTCWYYGSSDNGGVHYNNGVQNHFFYLLCEGGSGSNDGISYNITGIGIENARLIAYRALTVYCTAGTDYSAARTAWISAASDLNSSWASTVQAAWTAVGVSGSTPSPTSRLRAQGLNNDFDGDNKADYALFDYVNGNWYIYSSSANNWMAYGNNFGSYSYLPVPGDYDGNGKADVVDYSRSTAWWLVYYVGVNFTDAIHWGDYYCIPAPGDYDGDGKSDFALYNFVTGQWYIFKSSTLTWLAYGEVFGGYGLIPVPGDYNGGGKSDLAVYSENDAIWYLYYTEDGTADSLYFGGPGYVPAPGDYDYDGVTDFGLYDYWYGYWYVWSPVNGWIVYDYPMGDWYYAPVAGDFDGDGLSDLAVYSRYYGDWYIYYMGSGSGVHVTGFGGANFVPVLYWALYWYI